MLDIKVGVALPPRASAVRNVLRAGALRRAAEGIALTKSAIAERADCVQNAGKVNRVALLGLASTGLCDSGG